MYQAISIRQMTVNDAVLLNSVCIQTYSLNFSHHWEEGGLEGYVEDVFGHDMLLEELQDSDILYYVAFINEEPVAFMKLVRSPEIAAVKMTEDIELDKLYVLPDRKGMQIGRKLMDFAFELAARENRQRCWLVVLESNTPAISFYERLGFRFYSRLSIHYPLFKEERRPALRMCLELPPQRDMPQRDMNAVC
ncbi:MAG: GNAT family N-acetyltransferase [Chitinophagaceae bacterium]|nr:GNAT family N-acetyltransferase [Chitinophagaceae bacterium]